MFKLFLFVAFLAFAAAAPGNLAPAAVSYSTYTAPVYSARIHTVPLIHSTYAAPISYGYSGIGAFGYKAPYIAY